MKELKPKLILAESRGGRSGGTFKSLLIFLVVFVLGFFVGIKVNNINVDETEFVKKKDTQVVKPQMSSVKDEKPNLEGNRVLDENQVVEGESSIIDKENSAHNKEDSEIAAVPTNPVSPRNSDNSKDALELTQVTKSELNEEISKVNKNDNVFDNKETEYTLQISAFKKLERAQRVVDELRGKGYDAYIVPTLNSREENWNLIRIGKFKTKEEARNFVVLLREREGIAAIIKEFDYNPFKEFKD